MLLAPARAIGRLAVGSPYGLGTHTDIFHSHRASKREIGQRDGCLACRQVRIEASAQASAVIDNVHSASSNYRVAHPTDLPAQRITQVAKGNCSHEKCGQEP